MAYNAQQAYDETPVVSRTDELGGAPGYVESDLNQAGTGGGVKGAIANAAGRVEDMLDGNRGMNDNTGMLGNRDMNDVCDPAGVYNPDAASAKVTRHVQDELREREYLPAAVEETVVHHDIERVKPVLHREIHQTRLHEQVHHKVEAPIDLGITDVIQHRDADPCGNHVTGDLNMIKGTGTKQLGNHGVPGGIGGAGFIGGYSDETEPNTGLMNGSDTTTYGNEQAQDGKVKGIKGVINKIVPGPGPFKAPTAV